MSAPSAVERLVDTLRTRQVIAADAPAPDEAEHRPWFVAMMLGIAGWLAGILLLVFIETNFRVNTRTAIGMVGLALLVAAWAMYYADRKAVFLDQFALALSIAGQCALAWALLDDVDSGFRIASTLLVIQLVVLVLMPNRTARTLAALFGVIAWVYTVRFAVLSGRPDDIIFDNMMNTVRYGAGAISLAWMISWAPLLLLTTWLIRRESDWMARNLRVFARPLLAGALLGLAAGGIIAEPFLVPAFGGQVGLWISWQTIFPLLSIGLALYAAWCAFQLRSAGLTGFAIVAALFHLGRFYYLYGTSLTWKSVIMFCVGAAMLGAGMLLRRREPAGGLA